jgi:adenosylmethionine-8-amino-7-oxononanoate aminotransferase
MIGNHVFHRRLDYDYPVVDRGAGVYLYDTAGKRYLDAAGGALVVNIGHGVSEIAEAMATQAGRVAFAHGTQFSSQPLELYADALASVVPMPDPRIYLVSGGSEAVETAIKLARQVCVARGESGRYKVIARWSSYHGATLGALSASGRAPLRRVYSPLLIDLPHIAPCYCYRCSYGKTYPSCSILCADALEQEILRQGPETVSAFLAEPVVGATLAAVVPPQEYWLRVREICDRYSVLLIADEVMTGCGRTGRWFAIEHWGVEPDILVTAKGASGGYYPLGVVVSRGDLVDVIRSGSGSFTHGFTHANGPLGATVGLAVFQYMQANDLVTTAARMGRYLLDKLEALRQLPAVGDVRGLGLMAGVELVADKQNRRPFPAGQRIAHRVQAAAMERGLIVYIGIGLANGVDGDAVLLGPPFVITEEQVDQVVVLLCDAISAVTGEP